MCVSCDHQTYAHRSCECHVTTYHTVYTEEEGGDSKPESYAGALGRDVEDVSLTDGTEHVVVDEPKHVNHLWETFMDEPSL